MSKQTYKIRCSHCDNTEYMSKKEMNLFYIVCAVCSKRNTFYYLQERSLEMSTYTKREIAECVSNLYTNVIAIYGLKSALKVIRQVRIQLKEEKKRRMALPEAERGFDTPTKESRAKAKVKAKVKAKKDTKKSKKKSIGLFASLCLLFDEKGVNKVTHQEARACAKAAKPDSNLSHGHLKWYIKKYKERNRK